MTLKWWGPSGTRTHSACLFWLQCQRITPRRHNTFNFPPSKLWALGGGVGITLSCFPIISISYFFSFITFSIFISFYLQLYQKPFTKYHSCQQVIFYASVSHNVSHELKFLLFYLMNKSLSFTDLVKDTFA